MTLQEHIPFFRPSIGRPEIEEVVETLRSGWLTSGPKTAQFEKEFREYVGASHSLAVNSCTAGLHLALAALDIGPGDEVITTPLTFCATVNCILHVGATPVLADIGPDGNLDPDAVRRAITGSTKAILPVHYAGLPCRMDEILSIAARRDLKVVEDAAHAAGAEFEGFAIGSSGSKCGLVSDAVAFSFYASKNLTTGEGGMVTTPSTELSERMRSLCLHGISRDAWNRYRENGQWYYEVLECGFKYNLSDVQSAIGIHQLRKLDLMNERRRKIALRYNAAFADREELQTPCERVGSKHAWHLYPLRLNLDRLKIDRAAFCEELVAAGVSPSVHFIPIPLHPAFEGVVRMGDSCALALSEYKRLVSLPLYCDLREDQIEHICASVKGIVERFARKVFSMAGSPVGQAG